MDNLDGWIAELAPFDLWNERMIMAVFALFGLPSSYLDIGSGTGAMVNLARKLGIDAWGVDQLSRPDSWLVTADLRQPFDLDRRFTLVTSFEVAEHIPIEHDATFCNTVARHVAPGGKLMFSVAHPGQGGEEHVNLRPSTYWRSMLHDRGLAFQHDLSVRLALAWKLTETPQYWLSENVQVFDR